MQENILDKHVSVLKFSARARKAFHRLSIDTIDDLVNTPEETLFNVKNCGILTVQEIKERLTEHGLSLLEVPDKLPKAPDTHNPGGVPVQVLELTHENVPVLLKHISYREREIIELRFGFRDNHSYSLIDVGHIFKLTKQRIQQIENRALVKLCRLTNSTMEQLLDVFANMHKIDMKKKKRMRT